MFRDLAAVLSGLEDKVLSPEVSSFSDVPLLPLQDLYEAGELKWGTDEAQFIYILGNRSKQHLRLGKLQRSPAAALMGWCQDFLSLPFLLMEPESCFIHNPNTSPDFVRPWFVTRVINGMFSCSISVPVLSSWGAGGVRSPLAADAARPHGG